MRRFKLQSVLLIVSLSFGLSVLISYVFPYKVFGQVGSNMPDDATLVAQRETEVSSGLCSRSSGSIPSSDRACRSRYLWRCGTCSPEVRLSQLDRLFYPFSSVISSRESGGRVVVLYHPTYCHGRLRTDR